MFKGIYDKLYVNKIIFKHKLKMIKTGFFLILSKGNLYKFNY